jgi:hypothetical protein
MAQVEAETTSAEELQQKRLDRAKAMVSWKRAEPNQVFSLQVAVVLAEALEASEDVLRGLAVAKLADADAALVDRMKSKLRKMHRSAKDQYLKASVANRMGVQAVSKIFEPTGYDRMMPEQEKAMQAYIKEQQDGGGKWKKSSGGGKGAAIQPVAAAGPTSIQCREWCRVTRPGWDCCSSRDSTGRSSRAGGGRRPCRRQCREISGS